MATTKEPAEGGVTQKGAQPAAREASVQPAEGQQERGALRRTAEAEPGWLQTRGRRAGLPAGPFGLMRRLMEDMERFLGGAEGIPERPRGLEGADVIWMPSVEVRERDGNLVVRADLPGLEEKDIRVEVIGDSLVLEGERRIDREEERQGFWRSELVYGTFRRAIPLPEGVDLDSINARFDRGVLEISMALPAAERQQPRRIPLQTGRAPQQGPGQKH